MPFSKESREEITIYDCKYEIGLEMFQPIDGYEITIWAQT